MVNNINYTQLLNEIGHRSVDGLWGALICLFCSESDKIENILIEEYNRRELLSNQALVGYNGKYTDLLVIYNYMIYVVSNIISDAKQKMTFTEEYLKNMHQALFYGMKEESNQPYGQYKIVENGFFNGETLLNTAYPNEVPKRIRELIANSQTNMTLEEIAAFHLEFEKIHPFYDGNGRIGRAITLFQCLKYEHVPFAFIAEDSEEYYSTFTSDNGTKLLLKLFEKWQYSFHETYWKPFEF